MMSVRKPYTKESINYVAGLISFKRFMDLSLGFENNSNLLQTKAMKYSNG